MEKKRNPPPQKQVLKPQQTDVKPISPFRVLHADLPFYSDPDCQREVKNARLIILQCEDPTETIKTPEPLPTTRQYQLGEIVQWGFDHKRIWEESWYQDPETGEVKQAWKHSTEFIGKVYVERPNSDEGNPESGGEPHKNTK